MAAKSFAERFRVYIFLASLEILTTKRWETGTRIDPVPRGFPTSPASKREQRIPRGGAFAVARFLKRDWGMKYTGEAAGKKKKGKRTWINTEDQQNTTKGNRNFAPTAEHQSENLLRAKNPFLLWAFIFIAALLSEDELDRPSRRL